jgi:hypothetical protein
MTVFYERSGVSYDVCMHTYLLGMTGSAAETPSKEQSVIES